MSDSIEVLKIAPPVGVGGLSLLSIPLSDWVLILTMVYTILLIIDKMFPGRIHKLVEGITGIRAYRE